MTTNDRNRVRSSKAARLKAVLLGAALSLPHPARAQSVQEAGKQELREAYALLRAQQIRDAICGFKRAYDLTADPTSLLGRAYCELRLGHYSHARNLVAQVVPLQREAALNAELLGAIAEYQQGSSGSVRSAPTAPMILAELGAVDVRMRRYAFQLGSEYQPQTVTLAIKPGRLTPDLDSPADHHTLLVLSEDDFCPSPVRAGSRAVGRGTVPAQKPVKREPVRALGEMREPVRAPGEMFELLVEPDVKYELNVLPDRFKDFPHQILPSSVPEGVIRLSQEDQQASITTDVKFEGWMSTAKGADAKSPPIAKVQTEVKRGNDRIYKGQNREILVSPGRYLVRVIPPGYGFRYEASGWNEVQLVGGQTRTLDFQLQKRPVYRNPWFWVGLLGGAATVGLVVGLVVPELTDPSWDRGTTQWLVRLDPPR